MLLLDALDRHRGLLLRGRVPDWVIDDGVARGRLVRLFPRVYADPALVGHGPTLCRAALLYAGDMAALSHTTALAVHGLAGSPVEPLHVTVPSPQRLRGTDRLVVHRRCDFGRGPGLTRRRDGLDVVTLDRAVVESWPLLPLVDRRAPAIQAVRGRRTTPARLRTELAGLPNVAGRAALARLLDLLEAGCHSELEIWGHERVFDHPDLPPARTQYRVRLGTRTVYLDRAYPVEKVAVELDGAAFHGSSVQRQRDLHRDVDVATLGWLTVRFTHSDLHGDPAGCRRRLAEILAARRRQFGVA